MHRRILGLIAIVFALCLCGTSPEENARKLLTEMGVRYDRQSFVESVIQGKTEVVLLFLKAGMPPEKNNGGLSPLIEAARRAYSDTALALIDAGADLDSTDRYGVTALMYAAICGSVQVMERLIDAGADPNVKDIDGRTALVEALTSENDIPKQIIKRLLDAGADVNVKIQGDVTPLMMAASGDPEILGFLIEAGADVNAHDDQGTTAMQRARQNPENRKILKDAGAVE